MVGAHSLSKATSRLGISTNSLSELMQQHVDDLQQALTREKKFLAYASHELRTPITVLLSNSELLDKACQPQSIKEQKIRSRIMHSGLSMIGDY